MTDTRYNFDTKFSLRNKVTGVTYVNDVEGKKIYARAPHTGKATPVADFCITDLVWNGSNKDIDKITLLSDSSTEYTLASNHAALKNRILKEAYVSPGAILPSSLDKKFQHFAICEALYEFILLIVRAINNDTLPAGLTAVTLTITSSDTETLTNGTVIITATDEDSTAIQGLTIKGKVGSTNVNGTTNSSGQVSVTLEAAGTYAVDVNSTATTKYKAATKTGSVTATAITQNEGTG